MVISDNRFVILSFLVISWLPINGFMQPVVHALPIAIVLIGMLKKAIYTNWKPFIYTFFFISFYIIYSNLRGPHTAYWNTLVSLILYLPLCILIFRFRKVEEKDLIFLLKAVAYLSIIEFSVGLVQLLVFQGFRLELTSNSWDYVDGTTVAQSSHVYSIKMLLQGYLLLFNYKIISSTNRRNRKLVIIGIGLSFLGAIMSSYLIGIIMSMFFLIAYFAWKYLIRCFKLILRSRMELKGFVRNLVVVFSFVTLSAVAILIFAKTQPGNFKLISIIAEKLIELDFSNQSKFQKVSSLYEAINEVVLDNELNLLLGVGAGQYSSRAALMLTGDYLNPQPDYFPTSMSASTSRYIWPLWNREQRKIFRGSVLALPSSSISSILVEFGLLGLIFFSSFFIKMFKLKQSKLEGAKAIFMNGIPLLTLLFISQFLLDLWLEYGSFTIFMSLILILAQSIGNEKERLNEG